MADSVQKMNFRVLMNKKKTRLIYFLFFLFGFETGSIGSSESVIEQVHLRFGLLNESYTGPYTGAVSLSNAVDMEYERFLSQVSSFIIRGFFGYNLNISKLSYASVEVGTRAYIFSSGLSYSNTKSPVFVSMTPQWRYYAGINIGVSQVIVNSYGSVLDVHSALFEVCPNFGVIYQLTSTLGLELSGGYTVGFGFSTISVSATGHRAVMGLVYYL